MNLSRPSSPEIRHQHKQDVGLDIELNPHLQMESDLKKLIQLARSDFNQSRMRILHLIFPTALGESINLPAFFWFTFEEKLWKEELERSISQLTTETLTSYINRGSTGLAEICNFVKAAAITTRKDEEIHQYRARVEKKVEKGNLLWFSFAPEVDDHLEVCRFLSQSDEKSVKEFARNFQNADLDHWDKVCSVDSLQYEY